MPPILVVVVGAVGAFAAVRWLTREARRIDAELHPERYRAAERTPNPEPAVRLRRDQSGVYRPD